MSKWALLGFVALASIALFGGIILRNTILTGAATEKVNVEFIPKDGTLPDGPISFAFTPANSQNKISGIDVMIDVVGGKIEAWQGCKLLDGTDGSGLFENILSTTGAAARYTCVALKPDAQLPSMVLVEGDVVCDQGSSQVTVKIKPETQVSGNVANGAYEVAGTMTGTFNCDGSSGGGTPAPSQGATTDIVAKYSPEECSTSVGSTCKSVLTLGAADVNNKISAFMTTFKYEKDKVEVNIPEASVLGTSDFNSLLAQALPGPVNATPVPATNVLPTKSAGGGGTGSRSCTADADCQAICAVKNLPAGQPCPLKCDLASNLCIVDPSLVTGAPQPTLTGGPVPSGVVPSPIKKGCNSYVKKDLDNGSLTYLHFCYDVAASLASTKSITVEVKGKANGSGDVNMLNPKVVGPGKADGYTMNNAVLAYTVGEGNGSGDVTVNMKVRLQCVVKKPNAKDSVKIKVGLADGGLKEPIFKTADFKVNDKGIWEGKVQFDVAPRDDYKLLYKGEKHMQKKVCDAKPKEDFPGAYSCDKGKISLKNGTNEVDLSSIIHLVGDLPPGEQDGISNAKDQSLIRNLIGKRDKESAELADVNYDGVVNAVDHSCMISALSIRWDEQ